MMYVSCLKGTRFTGVFPPCSKYHCRTGVYWSTEIKNRQCNEQHVYSMGKEVHNCICVHTRGHLIYSVLHNEGHKLVVTTELSDYIHVLVDMYS